MVEADVGRHRSPWPARMLAAVVALLVCGPAVGPGFVLLRDMVFVPRQDLDLDALGMGGALPRAVPVDAVLGLLTAVVPGDLVQKAVLLGTVYFAVLGAARLIPPRPDGRAGVAAPVAGLVYGWSPYLAERLLMGHWSLLIAWAALPWIVAAGIRYRDGAPAALPRLVLVTVPATLTPTGALLAAGVVLAVLRGRRLVTMLGVLAVLASPWIVAGALHPAGGSSDPGGVAAFAARAEGWGGVLLSVLGTGGIWNAGAVPSSRDSVLLPVVTAALLALSAVGWWRAAALRGPARGLLVLGGVGLLLSLAGNAPGLRHLLELLVESVPGAGLLRDGQKWLAWWALPLALGAGLGARRVVATVHGRIPAAAALAGAAAIALPIIAVPDLGWGVGGRLQPVVYPPDWTQVREVLATDPGPGDVLVLPFGAYRSFGWNDDRPQLDPAPRWLTRPTVTDDGLAVDEVVVAGEDLRARTVAAAADDPAALARLGVGWVLVERGTPGRAVPSAVSTLPLAVDGADLALYRVPGARSGPRPSLGRVTAVLVAHACWAGALAGAVLWMTVLPSNLTVRRRSPRKRVPT